VTWPRGRGTFGSTHPTSPASRGLARRPRPALTSDAYARWLGEVLDALSVDRASIVGTSLGGWLAVDFATRHPDRVERLALITPSGTGRQKVGTLLLALLLLPFGRRGREITMRLVLGPAANTLGDMGDYVLLIHRHFRPRREKIPRFTDEALARLTMPVLAVVGGKDALLDSAGTKRRLERNAPHATVKLLPDAGHLLPRQTDRILTFLNPSPYPPTPGSTDDHELQLSGDGDEADGAACDADAATRQ
jgi:pimeloyl-ACP methyl ester carboxylesterase